VVEVFINNNLWAYLGKVRPNYRRLPASPPIACGARMGTVNPHAKAPTHCFGSDAQRCFSRLLQQPGWVRQAVNGQSGVACLEKLARAAGCHRATPTGSPVADWGSRTVVKLPGGYVQVQLQYLESCCHWAALGLEAWDLQLSFAQTVDQSRRGGALDEPQGFNGSGHQ
jgi:hypothetical protein